MAIKIESLPQELDHLESQCPVSALTIFVPGEDQEPTFYDICHLYLASSAQDKTRIRTLIHHKTAAQNHFLGYAYQCARRLKATRASFWLQMGLAATMLADQEMDPRDVLLALAELYVVAEETGIQPAPMFKEICSLGDFSRYAVVNSRRAGLYPVTQ